MAGCSELERSPKYRDNGIFCSEAMDLVVPGKQKLGQVRAVLAGDASDEDLFHNVGVKVKVEKKTCAQVFLGLRRRLGVRSWAGVLNAPAHLAASETIEFQPKPNPKAVAKSFNEASGQIGRASCRERV